MVELILEDEKGNKQKATDVGGTATVGTGDKKAVSLNASATAEAKAQKSIALKDIDTWSQSLTDGDQKSLATSLATIAGATVSNSDTAQLVNNESTGKSAGKGAADNENYLKAYNVAKQESDSYGSSQNRNNQYSVQRKISTEQMAEKMIDDKSIARDIRDKFNELTEKNPSLVTMKENIKKNWGENGLLVSGGDGNIEDATAMAYTLGNISGEGSSEIKQFLGNKFFGNNDTSDMSPDNHKIYGEGTETQKSVQNGISHVNKEVDRRETNVKNATDNVNPANFFNDEKGEIQKESQNKITKVEDNQRNQLIDKARQRLDDDKDTLKYLPKGNGADTLLKKLINTATESEMDKKIDNVLAGLKDDKDQPDAITSVAKDVVMQRFGREDARLVNSEVTDARDEFAVAAVAYQWVADNKWKKWKLSDDTVEQVQAQYEEKSKNLTQVIKDSGIKGLDAEQFKTGVILAIDAQENGKTINGNDTYKVDNNKLSEAVNNITVALSKKK